MGVGGSLVGLVLEGEFEVGTGAVVEVGEVLLVHGVDGFGEDGGDGLAALVGLGLDHLLHQGQALGELLALGGTGVIVSGFELGLEPCKINLLQEIIDGFCADAGLKERAPYLTAYL